MTTITDLPDGYRWMDAEECDHYSANADEWEGKGVLSIARTADSVGRKYTQDEADLAVPTDVQIPESLGLALRFAEIGEVQVSFTVPIEVCVDLVTGEVTRVVVIDEGVALDLGPDGKPNVNLRTIYTPVLDEEAVKRAVEIADGPDIEWPSWDFGW